MPRRPLRQSHRRGENSGEYDSEDLEDLEDTQRVSLPRMDAERDIGKVINKRYKINDRIGEGGMGVVYRAHDMQVDRAVAIKLVRRECLTDNKFLTRFRRELEVTSQFRHPSTIRVYEHGETRDGRPYMVMELLTGQSLADCLEDGRLPEGEALLYARQIAESLSEAHEHEIFHRDLKPDNIFIENVGVSTVVKVLDFGIAGGMDAMKLTQAGEVFGTPQYMSPEQCEGQPLDYRTDIYSLGCILYEMIEGKPPFKADSPMATMLKHVKNKVPPPRQASAPTIKLLQFSLRKDRNKRIQSAGRFSELIGDCIGAIRAAEEGRPIPEIPGLSRGGTISRMNTPTGLNPVYRTPSAPNSPVNTGENKGMTVVILLVAAAIVLIGFAMFSSNTVDPGPTDKSAGLTTTAGDTDESSTTAETALPNIRPLVNTNVTGAKVLVDGNEQCATPCEIEVPVGDGIKHEIRLQKDGYIDVVTNWQPASLNDKLPTMPAMQKLNNTINVKRKGKR